MLQLDENHPERSETAPLTDRELAVRIGVQPGTLRQWRMKGYGPPYLKVGRAVRYRVSDVQAWERAVLRNSDHDRMSA